MTESPRTNSALRKDRGVKRKKGHRTIPLALLYLGLFTQICSLFGVKNVHGQIFNMFGVDTISATNGPSFDFCSDPTSNSGATDNALSTTCTSGTPAYEFTVGNSFYREINFSTPKDVGTVILIQKDRKY